MGDADGYYDGRQVSTMPADEPARQRMGGAMRQRQVGLRAHLDQPGGGALEFLGLETLLGG